MSRTATAPHTMYSGRGAQLYDRIVAGDVTEIADIVRRIDRGRSRVLELASGSGRITLPLLRVAGAVTAVDLSPDLTDILRARAGDHPRLRVVCADILTWESTDVFDTVVLGTTSIALFDGDDRRRILERVRDWLTPEGELILTLRTPPMPRDDDVVAHGIGDGMTIREEFDRVGGVLHTTLVEGDDGYSVSTFIVSPETLIAELEAAGLAVRHQKCLSGEVADERIGDYRLIVAGRADRPTPSPAGPAYIEYFIPPSRWGQIEAESAEGTTVVLSDGRRVVDAISGLWNASLGYGNTAIADAIHDANLRASALPIFRRGSGHARRAAERLREYAGRDRFEAVFYSTSGSAALDSVVKLSRQIAKRTHGARRRRIVSLVGSYHGITSTAMALTGAYLRQDLYDVDERLHIKIPYDDVGTLRRIAGRFGDELAAIVMEPVLGSGALPVPDVMLAEVAALRERFGFLVVADEVATGFYRTGDRFASERWPVRPDALVLSKALTNGTCAASAVLLSPRVVDVLRDGDEVFWHGETQAGSPQSCAAILATLDEYERLDIARAVTVVSGALAESLDTLVDGARVTATGRGAMRALHLRHPDGSTLDVDDVHALVRECLRDGVIVQPAPSSLQLMPALTASPERIRKMVSLMRPAVERFLSGS